MCEGRRHDIRRIMRAWNSKTTPMRALKRRKLFDMVVRLKPGRSAYAYAAMLSSDTSGSCTWPAGACSIGTTCCNSLYHLSIRNAGQAPEEAMWSL